MLIVENVHKSFATAQGSLAVLRGVELQLPTGSSLALMGESGSGKSTLSAPDASWSTASPCRGAAKRSWRAGGAKASAWCSSSTT